jgi:hypothetical protein
MPIDTVDDRTDYSDASAEELIGEVPTFDGYAMPAKEPAPVDLLEVARVRAKKKKSEYNPLHSWFLRWRRLRIGKTSARTVVKGKTQLIDDHAQNTLNSPSASNEVDTIDAESEFDMFSDFDEVLEVEDEWEYIESTPKIVRFVSADGAVVEAGT